MNKHGAYQKKAQNIASVEARHALLVAGLEHPERVSKLIINSLSCQRSFAALEVPKLKVLPISLNTLKTLAAEIYAQHEGANGNGFIYLDSLRAKLKALVETHPSGRTIEAKAKRQTSKLEDLSNRLRELEAQIMERSDAYRDLYIRIKSLIEISIDEKTQLRISRLLEYHDNLYSSLFNSNGLINGGLRLVSGTQKDE